MSREEWDDPIFDLALRRRPRVWPLFALGVLLLAGSIGLTLLEAPEGSDATDAARHAQTSQQRTPDDDLTPLPRLSAPPTVRAVRAPRANPDLDPLAERR